MMNAAKITYALAFGLFALVCHAWALDPVDHKPVAELVAALKSGGQERIAQGVQVLLAKDANTGELFTTRALLLVTVNQQSGEWTVSIVHDKVVGSTVVIARNFQRVTGEDIPALASFDNRKEAEIAPKLATWGSAYYPDEVKRYQALGFHRLYTGQFALTTEPIFKEAMTPVFVDVMANVKDGSFVVLMVDQFGTCAKIASGNGFAEKP